MTTRTLLTLALAGLILPISAEAQVSRLDSRYGIKRNQNPAKKAAPKKAAKKTTSRKKAAAPKKAKAPKVQKATPTTAVIPPKKQSITPDLPPGFGADGADVLPQEAAEISTIRKFLIYANKGDMETLKTMFADQIHFSQITITKNGKDKEVTQNEAATPDDVINTIAAQTMFTGDYEVFQLLGGEKNDKKIILAWVQQSGPPQYMLLTLGLDTATGKIFSTAFTPFPNLPEVGEVSQNDVKFNADQLIKMGVSEYSGYAPIKSASAAEAGGWGAPDMEFTNDPKVREAILAPDISPMNIIGAIMIKDKYLQMRTTGAKFMEYAPQPLTQQFAPRVYLIGQNKEISRDELLSMFTQKDMEIPSSSHIIASGIKGHCLQFVISYTDEATKEKKYIRTCAIIDNQQKITGIMESKCVQASPKVNPSFKNTGVTTEVVEDSSATTTPKDWMEQFMQAWASGDAATWEKLLSEPVSNLYLPGMSKPATQVTKNEAIELMQQSMPSFLAGGYDIVQVQEKDKSLSKATIVFKNPAPNGQKVKAEIEINHIKQIHGFWVNMSYVESGEKFKQADFVSAVEGTAPEAVATEDQPIRDLPADIKGAEILHRTIEAIKANDAQQVAAALQTNHINQISMPKDNKTGLGRIGKPADILADVRELIPNIDTASYSIYVSQSNDMLAEGLLSINDGKAVGEANYLFSICFSHEGRVNAFSLRAPMSVEILSTKQSAGAPKVKVDAAAGSEQAGAAAIKSLCPADTDFSTDSLVKKAEATEPTYTTAHPASIAQNPQLASALANAKPAPEMLAKLLDNNRCTLADMYKLHRLSAAERKDSTMASFRASLGRHSIFANQVTVIGEPTPISPDALNARLDSPELLWGSNVSIYKIGAKGSSLQVIYRLGAEGSDSVFINVILLSNDLFVVHGVGESVFVNKEPQLAPGYKEVKSLFPNMQ